MACKNQEVVNEVPRYYSPVCLYPSLFVNLQALCPILMTMELTVFERLDFKFQQRYKTQKCSKINLQLGTFF